MLAGTSIVHNIVKPYLTIPTVESESTTCKEGGRLEARQGSAVQKAEALGISTPYFCSRKFRKVDISVTSNCRCCTLREQTCRLVEAEMTLFHFLNCAALTFGPHAVFYKATPLAEYDTLGTSVKAALVYLGTTFIKLVCLATFLQGSESEGFDTNQEVLKGLIGFLDVVGLYFALTQLTYRNISQTHKFQAVGLGWALADALLHRLAPLWVGAKGLEFTWDYLLQGIESNASLVFTVSLAALGSLMWIRKNKPAALVPLIYASAGIVATMPSITSYLFKGLNWEYPRVVGFEAAASLTMALITWRLFCSCQRPSS